MSSATLQENERSTLAALSDELIPPGGDLPSARDVEVAGALVDRALKVRPDWATPLRDVLAAAQGRPAADALEDLRGEHPEGYTLLTEVVANSYFLASPVRRALGWDGPPRVPIRDETKELTELTAPVIARGAAYRPAG